MAGFMIEGYQWVNMQWQPIEEGAIELGNPVKELAADRQIFHNSVRLFYYLKHEDHWLRATLNEEKQIQWTTLVPGAYPRWSPIGPHDSLLSSLKEQQKNIHETLTQAQQLPLPQPGKLKEEAVYPGSLSPAYQAILKATLSHNLDKPSELTPAEWQMILKTSLYTDQVPEGLSNIRNDLRLLRAYQGIAVFLMIDKINQYKFTINEYLPTLGQIYDYSAWLIFQELENISDFTPPTLSDRPLAEKKVGELPKVEQLVYQGLDTSQEKIYLALIQMFHSMTDKVTFHAPTGEFSIKELQALIKLSKANRLNLPLTDWQSRIWDEFTITVVDGNVSLEVFSDKLEKFKTVDLESPALFRIQFLTLMKNSFINNDQGSRFSATLCKEYAVAVMLSCTPEEIEEIWNRLNLINSDLYTLKNAVFRAFYVSLPPMSWNNKIEHPAIKVQLHRLLNNALLEEDRHFLISEIISWLPNPQAQRDFLVSHSWQKIDDLIEVLLSLKAKVSNELFESCVFDSRIIEYFARNYAFLLAFIDTTVPRSRLFEFVCIPSVIKVMTQKPESVIACLKKLSENDKLAFLGKPEVINLLSQDSHTHHLMRLIFATLSPQGQDYLTRTDAGKNLLSRLSSLRQFNVVLAYFPDAPSKIDYILRWILNNSGRYLGSLRYILWSFGISHDFNRFVKSSAFFQWIGSLETPQKTRASYELALFFLNYRPSPSLQTIASWRLLQAGQYTRSDIDKILNALPCTHRLQFLLCDTILAQWKHCKDANFPLTNLLVDKFIPSDLPWDEVMLGKFEPLIETLPYLAALFCKCTPSRFTDLVLKNSLLFETRLEECSKMEERIGRPLLDFEFTQVLNHLNTSSVMNHLDVKQLTGLREFSEKLKLKASGCGILHNFADNLSAKIAMEDVTPEVKRWKADHSRLKVTNN